MRTDLSATGSCPRTFQRPQVLHDGVEIPELCAEERRLKKRELPLGGSVEVDTDIGEMILRRSRVAHPAASVSALRVQLEAVLYDRMQGRDLVQHEVAVHEDTLLAMGT